MWHSHAEIGLPDAVVRPQRLAAALAARRGRSPARSRGRTDSQRLGDALLDQQDRSAVVAVGSRSAARRSGRRSSGARPIDGSSSISSSRRRGEPAADRQHLLLAARQRAGELVAPLGQDREQRRRCARGSASSRAGRPAGHRRPSRGSPSPSARGTPGGLPARARCRDARARAAGSGEQVADPRSVIVPAQRRARCRRSS